MPVSDAVGPAPAPRLEDIHTNLGNRLREAREQGWLGEGRRDRYHTGAADQRLKSMRKLATRTAMIHLGLPVAHGAAGRLSAEVGPENRFGLLPLLAEISGTDADDKRAPLVFAEDQNRAFAAVFGVADANPTADPRDLYTAATVLAGPTLAPRRPSEVRLSHLPTPPPAGTSPSQPSNTALLVEASSATIAA